MASVLRQASQEGFVRVIADEGVEAGRIVQRLHVMQQQGPANRSDANFLGYLEHLLKAFGSLPRDSASGAIAAVTMDSLTRKEIQVLQLTADGHSNASMTQILDASDSTVRTHLRNINSKLGARSRAEAVALGRRLGIVR